MSNFQASCIACITSIYPLVAVGRVRDDQTCKVNPRKSQYFVDFTSVVTFFYGNMHISSIDAVAFQAGSFILKVFLHICTLNSWQKFIIIQSIWINKCHAQNSRTKSSKIQNEPLKMIQSVSNILSVHNANAKILG